VPDLGYAGDADAHGGDLLLAQAQLLAGLGELVPARLGEQLRRRRPRGEDADLAQRGGTGEGAAGRSGRPSKGPDAGGSQVAAGRGGADAAARVRGAEPAGRHPYRGGRRCAGTTW